MRIDVSGNKPIEPKLIIFINHTMKRDGLRELVYHNAEARGKAFEDMFLNVFKFKKENIQYCRNFSKKQMIEKFDELYADAQKFENDPSHDIRDRNPIYITWIGFLLDEAYHRYMKEFTYDNKLQTRFLLSPSGEPLGACEYMMRMCLPKTQVTLMIDDQQCTHNEPSDRNYIDLDAGFTEEGVFVGDKGVHSISPEFGRNHYFF